MAGIRSDKVIWQIGDERVVVRATGGAKMAQVVDDKGEWVTVRGSQRQRILEAAQTHQKRPDTEEGMYVDSMDNPNNWKYRSGRSRRDRSDW